MALVYHALGRSADSDRMLAQASSQFGDTGAFFIAKIHAFRGEPDAAFEWLKRAYRQRDLALFMLKGEPLFKTLEHDPRFARLLDELKLPI